MTTLAHQIRLVPTRAQEEYLRRACGVARFAWNWGLAEWKPRFEAGELRHKSSASAGATYLDRAERIEELRQAARRARNRVPAIRRILLFGSLVAGKPTPRSDADLLVILRTSPHPEPRHRVPEILAGLAPLPCPVDVHVLTGEEVERFRREGSPLLRVALETGRDLLE